MKNRIIFILVFCIIAIAITWYLIQNHTTNMVPQNSIEMPEVKNEVEATTNIKSTKQEKTINLDDTYALNKLKTIFCKEDYRGLEIQYYQIDGLKDGVIEDKINQHLKNDLQDLIDEAIMQDKINKKNFDVFAVVNSNFANTLSITYHVSSYRPVDGKEEQEELLDDYIAENFDLTTGERIKLNDLFTEDTKAMDIFTANVYNEMISNETDLEPVNDEIESLHVVDYNDIEETMLYLAMCFNEGKDIKFAFDEQKIILSEYYACMYYEDMADKIVIYDQYKTDDSIFDGTYEALEDLPVLAKRFEADYEVIEQGKNYYMDVSLYDVYDSEDKNEKVFETAKEYLMHEMEKVKKMASQSSNEFFVMNYAYSLDTVPEDKNDVFKLTIEKYEYVTTKSLFDSQVYDEIKKVFTNVQREETGEAYCYHNLFMPYLDETYQDYEIKDETIYINKEGKIQEDLNL